MHACSVASAVSDSATLRAVAHQAPLSMGFSKQEYQSGLPFPSLEDLPDPGIEPWVSCTAGRFLLCNFFPQSYFIVTR